MASGVITGTTSNKYVICKLEWTSIKNEVGNYSDVTATLKYSRTNSGYTTSGKWSGSITINGVKKEVSTANEIYITQNSNTVAMSSTVRVYHNSNGTKSITISATGGIPAANLNTKCSGTVYLDVIDRSPLTISFDISNVTQNSAHIDVATSAIGDRWYYSKDGGTTWTLGSQNSAYAWNFSIDGFSPNTTYNIKIKVRKASNQIESVSETKTIKTLPIYVTEIITEDKLEIDVGSSIALNYSVLPSNASIKKLDIISSDNNVVVVNKNVLTALSKGNANITLTAQDGSGISKSVNVSTIQRVEGIITNQTEIVLSKTSSVELQYTVLPQNADNKNVIITSSDESIVMVEGNTIIGVENGNAIITILTEDGNYQVQIAISVFGDYVWYNYSQPIEILNATDVQHIKSNIITIRSMLLLKGYNVESLYNIIADINTPLINIFDILQNIEYNLDAISDNDAKSIYYIEPKTIGEYASNKNDIWRWISILNEMYNILTGSFGKWQYLLCLDGYPTIDENKILVRGEKVG